MTDALARIRARGSCRTFGPTAPAQALLDEIGQLAAAKTAGPFGTPLRFRLIDGSGARGPGRRLGTYGIVRGAALYLVGAVGGGARTADGIDQPMAVEDYGWVMEELVLEATGRGLGTCWMAGTFDRSGFARAMRLADGETMPAIVPLGVPAPARSALDAVMHIVAGSRGRRPWGSLFFREGHRSGSGPVEPKAASAPTLRPLRPLDPDEAGAWRACLEAVLVAPSARNAQPWRIVMEEGSERFKLLLAGPVAERSVRRLDAGIAMCHFALAAAAAGLAGRWVAEEPPRRPAGSGLVAVARWLAD